MPISRDENGDENGDPDEYTRSTDVYGMPEELEWDPKKTTPFDPFKDWGVEDEDWWTTKGKSYDERLKRNAEYDDETLPRHPLQKGGDLAK